MPALARGDAERLLRFVAVADDLATEEPFVPETLTELGRLVEADLVTYCQLDRVRRRPLGDVTRPGDEEVASEVPEDVQWSLLDVHPMCARQRRGFFAAQKLSDFLTLKELHRSWLYDVAFRPEGVERELDVAIPSPLWHTKVFLFDRRSLRDFTERDRLVLDLLQPHLGRLWHAARTRRALAAALVGLDHAEAHEARGVIMLGPRDEVEYTSEPARRLLREFAPDGALVDWLESGCRQPLVHGLGDRRLIVERVGDALLLEESRPDACLTTREREVLEWVARGETNAEIARTLWLAPSTVGKHLEHIYAKLGVRTRTAAVARYFGPIGREASEADAIAAKRLPPRR